MTTRQDLYIEQGVTWSWVYTWLDSAGDPVDITGYSARMAIKTRFDWNTEAYLSSGSDADGGSIALGDAAGTITLSMTAAQTTALVGDLSIYTLVPPENRQPVEPTVTLLYDLELVTGAGAVTRVLEGRVNVRRQVTG